MSNVTAVPIRPIKRSIVWWIVIGVVAAIAAGAWLSFAGPRDAVAGFLADNGGRKGVVTTASGLQYEVLSPGKGGPRPTDSDVTLVTYEGKFTDGTTFDKSTQPTPMEPTGVVPGFGEALKLMPKGSKYRFWIKPSLGYGAPRPAEAPPLDPTAAKLAKQVLVFDVEMLDFIPRAVLQQMQLQQQMMRQQQSGAGAPPAGMPPQ